MKKNFLFLPISMLMVCLCIVLLACSSESDPVDPVDPVDTRIAADSTANLGRMDSIANLARMDSVEVDFELLNSERKESTTFAYGENIVFQVTLYNHSKKAVKLPRARILVGGDDAFMVYTKEGELVGRPWDLIAVHAVYPEPTYSIESGGSFSWSCKWRDYVVESSEDDSLFEGYNKPFFFVQAEERDDLAKGAYYSKFSICLGNNINIECRKDFVVE